MEKETQFSSEEIVKIKEERAKSDASLIEGGAEYKNLSGVEVLQLQSWQIEQIRREMRQDIEKKIKELPPLFNEAEYKKIDPEELFRKWYEESKKAESEPEFFKNIRPAAGDYSYLGKTRNLKEIDLKTAYAIRDHARDLALAQVYFENNREAAQKIIEKAFNTLNNSILIKPRRFYDESGECTCSFAESLGFIANKLGFPDLADRFGRGTFCANSPQYREHGPAFGVHSRGEDYSIEKIQKNIKENVEWKVRELQLKEEQE